MPAGTLAPIAGDPFVVRDSAGALEAIAARVAETSSKLRSLARTSWTGGAAERAAMRTATLPPKLDKVVTSYSSAGAALRGYASSLAEAQARSAAALRAAASAQAEIAQLRAQQAAAPPDTSAQYDTAIASASARLSRAVASNEAAHDEQGAAALVATCHLREAAALGIKNQPWWRHVLSSAARFASSTWTTSLRVVTRVATSISALAGLAALAVSIAGLVFPPLEGAAAVLETISLVSGVMATCADTALAASGNGSWTSAGVDALALAPWAGSRLVSKAGRLLRNPTHAAASTGKIGEEEVATYPVVVGKGVKTRSINFRPKVADRNWGLRRSHICKHIFGPGPSPLADLDPAGTTDSWRAMIQELASRPTTARRAGGIEEVVGVFDKADGSGTFKLGIRLSRAADGSFDLVTLLTRQ